MVPRIANLVWKEALQFWRYRLLLIFLLIFPALNMFGAAEAVAAEIMHIPTAVYDQDRSRSSRDLVGMLRGSRLFDPDIYVGSQEELEHVLQEGTVRIGLVIPPHFGADLVSGGGTTVQVLQDGSDTLTARTSAAYLEAASYIYAERMATEGTFSVAVTQVETLDPRSRIWFNEELRKENFQIPAEMAAAVAWLATLLPAVAVVREREQGTLEQLFVTPLRSFELIVGKATLAAAITFVGFLEALAVSTLYLGVPMGGSLALLLLLGGFYIFVEIGWGLFISALVRTQGQAFIATLFWLLLESILSGQILPVETMPRAVQVAAQLMPSKHFSTITRGIMLRGSTMTHLWPQVIALALLGIGLYALAAARLRKRIG
ncbi:MAG: ABC transporter permease [Anaerolineae bacterium]|jgi:ABC-2 type transport system permease protein